MHPSTCPSLTPHAFIILLLPQMCVEENLVLMADEVYQSNVYIEDREFVSFRKVGTSQPAPTTSPCTALAPPPKTLQRLIPPTRPLSSPPEISPSPAPTPTSTRRTHWPHHPSQVAIEMGYTAKGSDLQLISYHSVSKGFLGECGLRGGYFELFGIDDEVKAQLYKLASISLCSNTIGQVRAGLANQDERRSAGLEE